MNQALVNRVLDASSTAGDSAVSRFVNATEFCDLMVSHRRMERLTGADRYRGLRDLDTGEVFLTDERRLLALRR